VARSLKILKESALNVEYLYAFVKQSGENALVVFRVEKTDEALKVLQQSGVEILKPEEIYKL